jgi:hypothetical protein
VTDEPTIRIRDGSLVTREEYNRMELQAQKANANCQVKSDSLPAYIDFIRQLRSGKEWLNDGRCCGQVCSDGVCCAPACLFGEALKYFHKSADAIEKLMKVVKPFADAAVDLDDDEYGHIWERAVAMNIDCDDLRAARAAYLGEKREN